ncbi:lytic murein transglycosylase B [Marichromatium bheemlicum]|uniref:Lytic murein transglycosylase B n=1 Tax=Marichromatium bheemlicum TaxID=365339 RepID=A0ABX1I8V3_9GAMM|nr:lytic murein transglycosylase B [Marichromatium bheemlicum]NKN32625.1 lytic murein transglycosylase B [Marichromatium bheemlicum]
MRTLFLLLSTLLLIATAEAAPSSYRNAAVAFVTETATRHGLDAEALATLIAAAEYRQEIIDAMEQPYEGKPWHRYRALFLTSERITGGRAFHAAHAEQLTRAQARYGVPAPVIVAIIGIETRYGEVLGRHRALDALTTLGFSYPRRAAFFRRELEQLILLGAEEEIDLRAVRGSYAGALGMPQFIPSSYRAYAVDFDGDGRRDLWHSSADVIGSVANYLARHGWRAGSPVAIPLERPPTTIPAVVRKAPRAPATTLGALRAAGIDPAAATGFAPETPANLMCLDGGAVGERCWITFANFYAITRYNHSNLYAMAVHQLSEAIGEPPP